MFEAFLYLNFRIEVYINTNIYATYRDLLVTIPESKVS